MAARKLKPHHQDDIKAKIQAANILHRLQKCYNGDLFLTDGQISIGKFLLNKVIADAKPDQDGTLNLADVTIRIGHHADHA